MLGNDQLIIQTKSPHGVHVLVAKTDRLERKINRVLGMIKISMDKSYVGKYDAGTLILSGAVRKGLAEKGAF